MKGFYIVIFILIIIISNSCTNEDNSPQVSDSYYPLIHDGQELYWRYKYRGGGSDTELVVWVNRVEKKDGIDYNMFVRQHIPSNSYDTFYVRKDNIGNVYNYMNGVDILGIDFTGNKPDSSKEFLYFSSSYQDSVKVPAGIYSNCVFVTCYASERDGGSFDYYAKNVGLIKSGWFKGTMELLEFHRISLEK